MRNKYRYFVLRSEKKKKNPSNPKENAVRPQYMESSTESEEEDDRKLHTNRVNNYSYLISITGSETRGREGGGVLCQTEFY